MRFKLRFQCLADGDGVGRSRGEVVWWDVDGIIGIVGIRDSQMLFGQQHQAFRCQFQLMANVSNEVLEFIFARASELIDETIERKKDGIQQT